MGLIALIAIAVYGSVVSAVAVATVVSSWSFRKIPLFWVVAAVSVALVPFAINEPLPTKSGTDYGAFSYFLSSVFSRFNLICFCGGVVSLIVSLLPIGTFRIASAVSWGFASALAVRSFLLLNS